MKKTFMTPSMEVKRFNRTSILTDSSATVPTNEDNAKNALTAGNVSEENIVKITL